MLQKYAVKLQRLHNLGQGSFKFDRLVDLETGVPNIPPTNLQKVVLKVATLLWPPHRYRVLYCIVIFGALCA